MYNRIASNGDPGIHFFSAIYLSVSTKWDKWLLVEDLYAVYNLWCQRWILIAADDTQIAIL